MKACITSSLSSSWKLAWGLYCVLQFLLVVALSISFLGCCSDSPEMKDILCVCYSNRDEICFQENEVWLHPLQAFANNHNPLMSHMLSQKDGEKI